MHFMKYLVLLAPMMALAAPTAPFPTEPLGQKKELLFSDDLNSATPLPAWHKVVPTFTFKDGMLVGDQTRVQDVPTADGKGIMKAHAAVHGLEVATGDSIVEIRFKLGQATKIMSVEYDDRNYKGSHYGHLFRAGVEKTRLTIMDQRDGSMRNDIRAMRQDPAKKAEGDKLCKDRQKSFPIQLDMETWYKLVIETVGEEMRVLIDGKAVGHFKSSGLAHATKSKIELGVLGQGGCWDDVRVWRAERATGGN
jgi:hypothetical protein